MTELLFYASHSEKSKALFTWFDSFDHGCLRPDFHRVQIEHWLWRNLQGKPWQTIDVAQSEAPRAWLNMPNYRTFGFEGADVIGDLLSFPFRDLDAVICTEVLEHCTDPARACSQMHEALKPGGKAYVATPFCWPDHRTPYYDDYWRFTEQGLERLLAEFELVEVTPIEWTREGFQLYDLIRRFECMGLASDVMLHTGYMVEATKGDA